MPTGTSSAVEVHRLQTDMAEHHARVTDSIAALAGGLNSADGIFNTGTQWMEEWNALASIGSEGGVQKKEDAVTYDVAIFGPELTGEGPTLGTEVRSILLAKDRDFTDAIINIDRDNFSGSAFDCAQRDIQVFRTVCAGVYTTNRQLFVHATPLDQAMGKAAYYRMMIRHMRSQLYVADLLSESVDKLAERIYSLEVIKDKYEATIFTLRRQLDDYHRANGGVGRDPNGELVSYTQQRASPSLLGSPTVEVPCAFVVVQVEELGNLRVRQRRVIEEGLVVLKRTLVALGNSFEGIRTNYHDENEKKEAFSMPDAYMMRFESCFAAVAFSAALHLELNASKGLWPQQLMDMTRFSKETTWTGLRVRIGVHFGNPATMDGPQGTTVQHFEGPAVDKAIRVASKGVAGDTCISTAAWDVYTTEKKEGRVPPSKKYTHLRGLVSDTIDCGRDIGFKVGEHVTKVWMEELAIRKEEPLEIDYSPISFFGIELSQVRHDDAAPTTEELLNAKDTELTLAQQEMDKMKLAIIKKDADADLLKEEMLGAMHSLRSHVSIRMFRAEQASECLETQLMTAHDALSSIESTAQMATVNAESIVDVDKRRRERFIVWEEGQEEDPQPNIAGHRSLPKVESFRAPKHKNIQLWKRLNGLVNAASSKTVDNVTRNVSIKSKKGEADGDTYSSLFRVHRIIRTFGLLVRQFVADGHVEDSDNQNISEDQFMTLFLRMTQDSVVGSHREVFNQKGFAAIESDDVEEANLGDDARLSRSVVGHLVRLFTIFKAYRVKSIVDSNRQDIDKEQSIQAAAPTKPPPKKGSKGPVKSVPAATPQHSRDADKENQKLWKEVTDLQFKLASANESLRKSEERAQILSSSRPTLVPKVTPSSISTISPPTSGPQPPVPAPTTPTHVVPTVPHQPAMFHAVAPQSTSTQSTQSAIVQPGFPKPLTCQTPPALESKTTQIPEGGGLSLVLLQDHGVVNVPHTTHIDMEFADHPTFSVLHALPHSGLPGVARTGSDSSVSMPQVSGPQVGASTNYVAGDAVGLRSTFDLEAQPTVKTAKGEHAPRFDELLSNITVPTPGASIPNGPQKLFDSSGRQVQTPEVVLRIKKKPHDPASVGDLVVCSSGAQSSGHRVLLYPSRRDGPSGGSQVDHTPSTGTGVQGDIGIKGIRSLSTMDGPSQLSYRHLKPPEDGAHLVGNPPHAVLNTYEPLDVRGYGANHPAPTHQKPRASQSEGLDAHAAFEGTGGILSVGGKGLSPLKRPYEGTPKQPIEHYTMANPYVQGTGLLRPIQGIPLTAGHRSPDVGVVPTPENIEWDSHAHPGITGRSPKSAAHGEGSRTTPDGVLRGTELHFAMNRPDNQAVLKQAEAERDAYLIKQDRLQRQLAELRELQAISKQQLNVNGSQQGRAVDTRTARQFVPFGGVELKPQSRQSKKV